jgi:hypothetical protein
MISLPKNPAEHWMFLQKRPVFGGAGEKPSTPSTSVDQNKNKQPENQQQREAREKAEREQSTKNLDTRYETYDHLKTADKVDIPVPRTALSMRNALQNNAEIKSAAEAIQKTDKNFNLQKFVDDLMQGILERAGTPDQISKIEGSKKDRATQAADKAKLVNDWLRNNKIEKFQIVDGKWNFYTTKVNNGKKEEVQVQDKVRLNIDTSDEGKNREELNREYGRKKLEQEKAAKVVADQDRQKPESLEQVSCEPVDLKADLTADQLLNSLEANIAKGAQSKINAAEMKTALMNYISLKDQSQDTPEQKFKNFISTLLKADYTSIGIDKGAFVFKKKDGTVNKNPLGLQDTVGGSRKANAHENLNRRDEEKVKEAQAKMAQEKVDREPRPTALDGTEREVAKLVTGKTEVTLDDLAKVDQRYLRAAEKILSYSNGAPVEFTIPHNDKPLSTKFYLAQDGSYMLSWDKNQAFRKYFPRAKGEQGLQEAKSFFIQALNNGNVVQELQRNALRNPEDIAYWGQKIDNGPTEVNRGYQYEFDWAVGLSRDPKVTFWPLPHGEVEVHIKQASVSPSGEYRFRAGGFQDAMRTIRQLQLRAEKGDERDPRDEQEEQERRYFESTESGQGLNGIRDMAKSLSAGRVLGMKSMRNLENVNGQIQESGPRGHLVEIDWMQKLETPQTLQVIHQGNGNFQFNLLPSGQSLGSFNGNPGEAMNFGLRAVAELRQRLTTKGGEKQMDQDFNNLLEQYNAKKPNSPLERRDGVVVTASVAEQGLVQMAFPGMQARSFLLGSLDNPNLAEMNRAAREGYLVPKNKAAEADPEPEMKEPPKAAESVPVTLETGKENLVQDKDVIKAVVNDVLKGVNPANYEKAKEYLSYRMHIMDRQFTGSPDEVKKQYQEFAWNSLAEMVEVKREIGETWESKSFQDRVKAHLRSPDFPAQLDKKFNKNTDSKIDISEENQTKLNQLPVTRAVISGWQDSLMQVTNQLYLQDQEQVKGAKEAYLKGLGESLAKILTETPKKQGELQLNYDRRVKSALVKAVKFPNIFIREYMANQQAKEQEKKYKDYQERQRVAANAQKEQAEVKAKPHLMSFDEFAQASTYTEVPRQARDLIKNTDNLDTSRIYLARTQGNSAVADGRVSFNIEAGDKPPYRPMTVNVYKGLRGLEVSVAPGWNNYVEGGNRSMPAAAEKNVIKTLINVGLRNDGGYADRITVAQTPANAPSPEQQPPAGQKTAPDQNRQAPGNAQPNAVPVQQPATQPPTQPAGSPAQKPAQQPPAQPGNTPGNKPEQKPVAPPAQPPKQPATPSSGPGQLPVAGADRGSGKPA